MSYELRIKGVLACDDIRREANGKFILIGIYASNIRFSKFPSGTVLCFFIIAEPTELGEMELDFRAKFDDKVIYETSGKIQTDTLGTTHIPLRNVLLEATAPANLTLEVRKASSDWEEVFNIPILGPQQATT